LTTPTLNIRLVDVDRGKLDYEWELSQEWLRRAFDGTEAEPSAPGHVTVTVNKDGPQVLLRGWAKASVTMPCARTGDPVPLALRAELVVLLSPAPTAGPRGTAHQSSKKRAPSSKTTGAEPTSPKSASRKPAHKPESELSWEEAADDYYTGEQIELDDLVREFLILELPMMPIRSDLRDGERPAIPAAPDSTSGGDADEIDPRLRPLAEIASRLKKTIKE
jgi:uncharacterized protein